MHTTRYGVGSIPGVLTKQLLPLREKKFGLNDDRMFLVTINNSLIFSPPHLEKKTLNSVPTDFQGKLHTLNNIHEIQKSFRKHKPIHTNPLMRTSFMACMFARLQSFGLYIGSPKKLAYTKDIPDGIV